MKYVLLTIILGCMFILGCANETRTIPNSITYNAKFTVLKLNPDSIRFATEPAISNNQVVYGSNIDEWSSYDLVTRKTKKTSEEIYKRAIDEYKQIKYGSVTFNNSNMNFKDKKTGEIILQIADNGGHLFGLGENYIVWSDYLVGKPDIIHIMKIADRSVRDIVPSQEFIATAGENYSGTPGFAVFELNVNSNIIIVQTSKCIYLYDAITLEETKVVCDENIMTRMRVYGDKILFQGNSANKPVDGHVNWDVFLVEI
jgi:hypothetical protein